MRVAFYTLGCKLNQSESEALASAFQCQGFFISSDISEADIIIINTCTVTSKSEQKARRIIRKISREKPESVIIATGCYAEVDPEAPVFLDERIVVFPQSSKHLLLDIPRCIKGKSLPEAVAFFKQALFKQASICVPGKKETEEQFAYTSDALQFHARPFLKIQDGCNRRCSYCRVPYARGNSVSLALLEAVNRIVRLEKEGYRETVLTGVNVTDYRDRGEDFASLLTMMLSATETIRIRLSSLEPDHMPDRLLSVLEHERICPHFHIPFQSGSSKVLSLMRRPYTADMVNKIVSVLRDIKDDPFIAGDVLAGFPGEDEDDFMKTVELVENGGFSNLHVFPFSPRPGTPAVTMKPRVPERIIKERTQQLHMIAETHYKHYRKRWQSRNINVVLEHPRETKTPGVWVGISENYLKAAVTQLPRILQKRGCLVEAKITAVADHDEICRTVCVDTAEVK